MEWEEREEEEEERERSRTFLCFLCFFEDFLVFSGFSGDLSLDRLESRESPESLEWSRLSLCFLRRSISCRKSEGSSLYLPSPLWLLSFVCFVSSCINPCFLKALGEMSILLQKTLNTTSETKGEVWFHEIHAKRTIQTHSRLRLCLNNGCLANVPGSKVSLFTDDKNALCITDVFNILCFLKNIVPYKSMAGFSSLRNSH